MENLQAAVSVSLDITKRSIFARRNNEIEYDFPLELHNNSKVYNDHVPSQIDVYKTSISVK